MTIEIVDFPIKHGGSFHSYVTNYQRVCVVTHRLLDVPNWFPLVSTKQKGFTVRCSQFHATLVLLEDKQKHVIWSSISSQMLHVVFLFATFTQQITQM